MATGVHGDLDHVARHVVMEYTNIPEYVTILNLHAEGKNVKAMQFIVTRKSAMTFAVQV